MQTIHRELSALGWEEAAPEGLTLSDREVHLWAWALQVHDSQRDTLASLLAADERLRMNRFHFKRDRLAYLAGRATLRRILGSYLLLAPQAVRFAYSEHGKPSLAPEQGCLEFNLSHTNGLAVAAFSWNLRLGVDVEDKHAIALSVADDFFSEDEHTSLRTLVGEKQIDGFYNCWTRKEAIAKAEGLGLNLPLAKFSVSLRPSDQPRVLAAGGVLSREWKLYALPLGKNTIGALAVSELPKPLKLFYLSSRSPIYGEGTMEPMSGVEPLTY